MRDMGEGTLNRAILHVDMDAFYASVEQHDNPALRGKPVIVGGRPEARGVVSAASYEARKFGVHSAMSSAMAKRLCPQGIFISGNYQRYAEISAQIQEVFTRYTPAVLPLSCDEAFLDITGSLALFGSPLTIARSIKDVIRAETGLTASVGLAGTLFVAKIASELDKPDGLTVIYDDEVLTRLAPLPVRAMWGVGKVAEKRLHKFGILTIGDLQGWPRQQLVENFGEFGEHMYNLCRGIDPRVIDPDATEPEKSISNEHTFDHDLTDPAELEHMLLFLADKVARRARKAGLSGRVVQIKVKYADFSQITRRISLPAPTSCAQEIFTISRKLLREKSECGRRAIRLLGVCLSGFGEVGEDQLTLFAPDCTQISGKMARAERAADVILDKLGRGAIGRGSLMLGQDKE